MKRILSTLLAVVLLLGCLSVASMAEEVPTLTIGIPSKPDVTDYYDNVLTKYMEEKLGIKIEFALYSSEYKNQLALQISANEKLPDILLNFNLWDVRDQYGEDGYFLDLKPLIEEYCVNWWKNYEYLSEPDKENIFAYGLDPANGCMYGYPGIEEVTLMVTEQPTVINKAWLDAIGEDIPRTVEDLYVVLQKFATEDPNGNGIADEIPVLGSTAGFMEDCIQFLMNAFVHMDDTYYWNCTDGEIWAPYVADEYREGLIYLNKLYTEGLISPLVFTMNGTESSSTIRNAISPLEGVTTAGLVTNVNALDVNNGAESYLEYVAFPPLEDATGKGGYTPMAGNTYSYQQFVTKDCEDVELAMKFLDTLSSWDVYLLAGFGVEGEHWVREPGITNRNTPGQIRVLKSISGPNNIAWSQATWNMKQMVTCPDGCICSIYVDDGSWNSKVSQLSAVTWQYTHAARQLEEPVYSLIYTADEKETMNDYEFNAFSKEQRALFITGALDPNDDGVWQNYLNEMEARGLYSAIEIVQTAYDRMMGK